MLTEQGKRARNPYSWMFQQKVGNKEEIRCLKTTANAGEKDMNQEGLKEWNMKSSAQNLSEDALYLKSHAQLIVNLLFCIHPNHKFDDDYSDKNLIFLCLHEESK